MSVSGNNYTKCLIVLYALNIIIITGDGFMNIPVTGNTSFVVYLIILIVAAVFIGGAVIAGIISRKKKK